MAAWLTSRMPAPISSAKPIASTTTTPICHVPVPISCTSRSAIRMPTATPSASSTARRRGWPRESPSASTADTGAKNGWGWPTISLAACHATAAARPVCRISSQAPVTRSSRRRAEERTAATAWASRRRSVRSLTR